MVALVVGMRDQRDATRQQLGTRRVDVDGAGVVGPVEGDAMIGAWLLAVFQFRLGDGGAKIDIPERRCLGRIDLFARQHSQNDQNS